MIDVTDERAKLRLWAEQERQQGRIERSMYRRVYTLLNSQYFQSSKLIRQDQLSRVNVLIQSYESRLRDLLLSYYKTSAITFGKSFYDSLSQKSFMYHIEKRALLEEFWASIRIIFARQALIKAKTINETTKDRFNTIINRGLGEGLSNQGIADLLYSTGKLQAPWQAKRIVRTEVHSASVQSTLEAANTTGRIRRKEWLTAKDERVRDTGLFNHADAHGETVSLNEPFVATGEALNHPGDYEHGSAGNIINCRCVLIFHTN